MASVSYQAYIDWETTHNQRNGFPVYSILTFKIFGWIKQLFKRKLLIVTVRVILTI